MTDAEQEQDRLASKLYTMKLGQRLTGHEGAYVRVPGGWVFTVYQLDHSTMSSVFVPFNAEHRMEIPGF